MTTTPPTSKYTSIRVTHKLHAELTAYAKRLSLEHDRPVSLDEAIRTLLLQLK